MRPILGLTIALAGICFAVYLGLWVMFVGGIVDVVDAIRSPALPASQIAWGVVKVILAGFVATFISFFSVAVGRAVAGT